MIIGSFPIGKFTDPKRKSEIRPHELDFFFGGEKNLLWKLLGASVGKELRTKEEVIDYLEEKGLAVGDVIRSCRRKGGRASDSDLYDIEWNHDLLEIIRRNRIETVYFTSKKVQGWFNRLFPEAKLQEILLISPSAQSVRSIVKTEGFLKWRRTHPQAPVRDYIFWVYSNIFRET